MCMSTSEYPQIQVFSIQLHLKHCTTYSFLYPLKKCSRSSIGSEDQVVIHVHLGVLFHPFSGVSHRGSPVQKMYFTFEPQTHRWFLRLGNPHQSKAFIKFGRPTPDQVTSTGPLSAPILAFLGWSHSLGQTTNGPISCVHLQMCNLIRDTPPEPPDQVPRPNSCKHQWMPWYDLAHPNPGSHESKEAQSGQLLGH